MYGEIVLNTVYSVCMYKHVEIYQKGKGKGITFI